MNLGGPRFVVAVCLFVLIESSSVFAQTNTTNVSEYKTIMWLSGKTLEKDGSCPQVMALLKSMGINTAMVFNEGDPKPFIDAGMLYYVENMVNRGLCLKWSSKVQDWDAFVTKWHKGGRKSAAFERDYCLDDPEWIKWAETQMKKLVAKHKDNKPVAYDIRDELSVTISANPFDYDFNPIALKSFREWLKTQYKDLQQLNEKWATEFKSWDEVMPFSTDQIKNRMASGEAIPRGNPDWQTLAKLKFNIETARKNPVQWNFAPWADFRSYMDTSLARALQKIRAASREIDAKTPVGIEGTQMPHAFGGYDLWKLSQSIDWVEPYDIGCSREIFGSFMPGAFIVTTVGEKNANEAGKRLWHLLLEGDSGCIIWWSEDCIDVSGPKPALTKRAEELKPVMEEVKREYAARFAGAEKIYDPVAIHYSQASIQVDWLIGSIEDGITWHRRFSSYEAEHNRISKVRSGWLKLFQDAGYSPRFVSSEQIGKGELKKYKVLVLPCSLAISDGEIREIEQFIKDGGAVYCDGLPGVFDEHCVLRAKSMFEKFLPCIASDEKSFVIKGGKSVERAGDIAEYPKIRATRKAADEWIKWLKGNLSFKPEVEIAVDDATAPYIRIYRFIKDGKKFAAFEQNMDYRMGEDLKQHSSSSGKMSPVNIKVISLTPATNIVVNSDRPTILDY